MSNETTLEAAKRIIAGRVFGPFREAGELPGDRASFRFDTAARAYLWNRRVRGMGAARALELAAPYALRPYSERPPQWFGPRGGAGAAFDRSGDSFRWIESTGDAGLRFVAWADELPGGPDHRGWYSRADDFGDTFRGGVWQLPGRNGCARFVYGYAEFEAGGRREMNPGSAAVCVSDILEADRRGADSAWDRQEESDAARDAARYADGIAEREAESSREYDSGYQLGREAAEADADAIAARRELLPLLAELRSLRRSAMAGSVPAACKALRDKVDSLLETISESRERRDNLWSDCGTWALEPWRAGFCDSAEDGFVRAVRLGYAKPGDWQGPADRNPCFLEAGQ